jgi:protoporphyrinogen oxidase
VTRVVVLGGGPTGLATALALAEGGTQVTLLERQDRVGGNAGSFQVAGVNVDFGSHRLHPASHPDVLERISSLLGDDLLVRPRHGRIRLLGRWIHFPLQPVDLALRMHPSFALGVASDLARKALPTRPTAGRESFATVLEAGLGRTICREFYFPYARKLWGLAPDQISPAQAYRRVSAGSIGKMLRRLLPGGTGSGAANTKGIFYYPRLGFGQICDALCAAARSAGADIRLSHTITGVRLSQEKATVMFRGAADAQTLDADQVFSTIPITVLSRLLHPEPPPDVRQAAASLDFRAMLLVYLVLDTDQFTEFDAHYFPGSDIRFSRISEPKNYAAVTEPQGRTVLCAEIPCDQNDELWSMTDDALGRLVAEGLSDAGLPIRCSVTSVEVKRVPFIYPLYRHGYEGHLHTLDTWTSDLPRLLSFGRQGLYVHDNTHHAIYMGLAAARCLRDDGSIDGDRWRSERRTFETHVVED